MAYEDPDLLAERIAAMKKKLGIDPDKKAKPAPVEEKPAPEPAVKAPAPERQIEEPKALTKQQEVRKALPLSKEQIEARLDKEFPKGYVLRPYNKEAVDDLAAKPVVEKIRAAHKMNYTIIEGLQGELRNLYVDKGAEIGTIMKDMRAGMETISGTDSQGKSFKAYVPSKDGIDMDVKGKKGILVLTGEEEDGKPVIAHVSSKELFSVKRDLGTLKFNDAMCMLQISKGMVIGEIAQRVAVLGDDVKTEKVKAWILPHFAEADRKEVSDYWDKAVEQAKGKTLDEVMKAGIFLVNEVKNGAEKKDISEIMKEGILKLQTDGVPELTPAEKDVTKLMSLPTPSSLMALADTGAGKAKFNI